MADYIGDAGDNHYIGTDEADLFFGWSGDDSFDGLGGDDYIIGGSGTDILIGGAGIDFVDFSPDEFDAAGPIQHGVTVNLALEMAIDGWGFTDTLIGIEGVAGTRYADNITGDEQENLFNGGRGNDVIDGAGGNDTIEYVQDGFDSVPISQGAYVDLANGTATDGYGDTDTLISIENVYGSHLGDTVFGSAGGNQIYAGDGADIVDGGGVNDGTYDLLDGGAGADTLTLRNNGVMRGGEGDDRLIGVHVDFEEDYINIAYDTSAVGIVVNLTASTAGGLAGGDNINGFLISDGLGGTDTVTGVDLITDSAFDDVFYVDSTYQNGGGYNLSHIGLSAGNDTVTFDGVDIARISYDLAGGAVSADMEAGTATDLVSGNSFIGFDAFTGETQLQGSRFDDVIYGNEGNDQRIRGNDGDDFIMGRGGDDRIQGEGGAADVAAYSGNRSDYLITDLGGNSVQIQDLRVGPNDGTDTVSTTEFFQFADGTLSFADLFSNIITGTEGKDILIGTGGTDSIYGLGGDDKITAGAGNDLLDGGTGKDQMTGGTGNDTYIVENTGDSVNEKGGEGTDLVKSSVNETLSSNVENLTLTGSGNINGTGNNLANVITGNSGNNNLNGGSGDDSLNGDAGADTLNGGGGIDTLNGGSDNDTLNGQAESDTLYGDAGDDALYGGGGNDILSGGSDNDTLNGQADHDVIYGNDGNDTLIGEGGNDVLDGGLGNDFLSGGSESDTFMFRLGDGHDTISGFVAGSSSVDVIDLSSFNFTDFDEVMSFATASGNSTVFEFDSESSIILQNVAFVNLTSADFII